MRPPTPEVQDNWFSFDGVSVVRFTPKQGLFNCFQKISGPHYKEHLIVYTDKGSFNCWYDSKKDKFRLQRLK